MGPTPTYCPRAHQTFLHVHRRRFTVAVWHRRAGKTVWAINELIGTALRKPGSESAYISPTYVQSKRIAWRYLKHYAKPYEFIFNEADLVATAPNGSVIYLLGAANADNIRGIGLDDCVLDEVAQIPETAWTQVIRPALSDRMGKAIFVGTPQGQNNLFWRLWERAPSLPDWCRQMLIATDTTAIDPAELEQMRTEMRKSDFAQEMLCDWHAAIRGAFYGDEMTAAEAQGRIGNVPHDKSLQVHTSWDLGYDDLTVVWCWQLMGAKICALECMAFEQTALPDIIEHLSKKPYRYGKHFGPHDLKVHEFGSGRTRYEIAQSLGFHFTVAPKWPIRDGIEATRSLLSRMWFDRTLCREGIEALRLYRTEYNEITRVYCLTPLHSWESDYADAVRYFAICFQEGLDARSQPLDYSRLDRMVV